VPGGVLERWLEEVIAAPGATSLSDATAARGVLLDDALHALPVLAELEGAFIDVGSGGGSPGIPLAASMPERAFTLLEAERRKCAFLERFAAELPNVEVVWGRAEEQPVDGYGVALAKALAKPPVAVELCLPLVTPGGAAVLWVGRDVDLDPVRRVAERLGGRVESDLEGLAVVRKLTATPAGFPRRPGMAKKRPLA
jgi:16S rRNA (guanine527-N7)-methyltransferase